MTHGGKNENDVDETGAPRDCKDLTDSEVQLVHQLLLLLHLLFTKYKALPVNLKVSARTYFHF